MLYMLYILYIYLRFDNRIYSYAIMYPYTVDLNLMLICIDLSEM